MVDRVLDVEFEGFFFGQVVWEFAVVEEKATGEDGLLEVVINGEVLFICKIHKLKIYS